MPLTVKRVERLREPGRYGDGDGLVLQVSPSGTKSWLFRYERSGRERWMGLGSIRTFNLEEAREHARQARQLLHGGTDPRDHRDARRAAEKLEATKTITFEDAAGKYFESHERGWKNAKHRGQFLSTLKAYAFPVIGTLPVASIKTELVLKVIEPLWTDKHNPRVETANRVRARIEAVLDWCTVRGYRTGENPARWKGHIAEALPKRSKVAKTKHHPALPYDQVASFMAELDQREGIGARALAFTILTAARTGEILGATWNEIDLTAKTWSIPAGRMKSAKAHRVPLSDKAVEILEALPREHGNPFVFPGALGGGLGSVAMLKLLARMERSDITVHGFRSSFRDWAAEQTSYQNHIVEMALAHAIGNQVEASYRRGDLFDPRRRLMSDWATYCCTPPRSEADNVTPMRRPRP